MLETLTITDDKATGTIRNSDPIPQAFLGRWGRTAAVQVVEQVEERIAAPRDPGFEGRVAGWNLRRGLARDMAQGFLNQLGGMAGGHRAGYSLGLLNRERLHFELGVDVQRRESPLLNGTDHGVLARGTMRW